MSVLCITQQKHGPISSTVHSLIPYFTIFYSPPMNIPSFPTSLSKRFESFLLVPGARVQEWGVDQSLTHDCKTHTCSGSAVAHIVKSIFRKPNLGSLKLDVLQNLTKKYNSTYFRFSGIFQQNFGERNPDLATHSWLTHSILIPTVWAKAAACNSCPGAVVILINTHSSWV